MYQLTFYRLLFSELTASFRGHPLDGKKISFPEGYRAVIVTESKRPLSEDAERKFHVNMQLDIKLINDILQRLLT